MTWQSVLGSPDAFTAGALTDLENYSDWARMAGNIGSGELVIYRYSTNIVTADAASSYGAYRKENASITSADHEARASVNIQGGDYPGVACRVQADGKCYIARVRQSTGDLTIDHYNGVTTVTNLATQAASYSGAGTLRLRAVTSGGNVLLTAQWNSETELTYTHDSDATVTRITAQGYPGLMTRDGGGGTASSMDDFDVWQDVTSGIPAGILAALLDDNAL